jgi:hypothetical protein
VAESEYDDKEKDPAETPDQSKHSAQAGGTDAAVKKLPDFDAPEAAQARQEREAEDEGGE